MVVTDLVVGNKGKQGLMRFELGAEGSTFYEPLVLLTALCSGRWGASS